MIEGIKVAGRQTELKFQNHIIDSYKFQGGHAAKWGSEFQKGKPDLICALPKWGVHLLEVKHLPLFGSKQQRVRNALSEKQKDECKLYLNAGGIVFAAVVGYGTHSRDAKLGLFHALVGDWFTSDTLWVDYVAGKGFDMNEAMRNTMVRK